MPSIPEPQIMELDPNDENLILEIPEDVSSSAGKEEEPTRRRVKIFCFFSVFIFYNLLVEQHR